MNKIYKIMLTALTVVAVGVGTASRVKASEKDAMYLSKKSVSVTVGKSFTLKSKGKAKVNVKFTDQKADVKIKVSASNAKVVEVKKISDTSYKIKGLKAGKATLYIESAADPERKEKLVVKVSKKKKVEFGSVITVTEKEFEKEVLKHKGMAVVNFSQPFCHYCILLDPIYDTASKKARDIKFTKINLYEALDLADTYFVQGTPTLLVFENGKLTKTGGYWPDMTADALITELRRK